MADVTVTNTKLTAFNDFKALTLNAATETTDATAQKFVFTPTGKDNHALIVVYNAAAEALTVTVAAGTAGPFSYGALTDTLAASIGIHVMQIETGRYMLANGTIEVSFTPGSSKDLKNDNALQVCMVEMLPN